MSFSQKSFLVWVFFVSFFSLSFLNLPSFKANHFDLKKIPSKIIEVERQSLKNSNKSFSLYLTPYFSHFKEKEVSFPKSYFSFYLLAKLVPIEGKVDEKSSLIRYQVKKGDTLFKIARKFGVSLSSIVIVNQKKKSSYLHPGDQLLINLKTGFLHQVKENETLKEIAKKYHLPLKILKEANNLEEVEPGQIILIPQKRFFNHKKEKKENSEDFFSYFQIPATGWQKKDLKKDLSEIYIFNSCGTPVYAAASGIVVFAKKGFNNGLGNYIEIQHPNGKKTLYAHLEKILVKSGDFVLKGEKIGTMGKSGKRKFQKKGCFLYFQIK